MIEFSPKFGNIAKALLAVQSQVSVVVRDATNPHYKNRYATLENVVAAVRPHCIENHLVILQSAGVPEDGMMPVETRIIHAESGEWLSSTIALPATKQDAQGYASAITYACRYSLMSLFCLPPSDDDGTAAVDNSGAKKDKAKPKREYVFPENQKSHTAGGMTQMDKRTISDGTQKSSGQAKKDNDQELAAMIDQCSTVTDLLNLVEEQDAAIAAMPANWQNLWWEKYDTRQADLQSVNILAGG